MVSRVLRLRVRIKAIIEALLIHITDGQFKGPISGFLARIMEGGKYLPDKFLTPMEITELSFDPLGRLM